MSDPIVTVARFANALEAELARNFLETNGIPAQVTGANAAILRAGALGGLASIYVRQSDAERAAELLSEHFAKAELNEDWEDAVEDDDDVWVCSFCGAAMSDAFDTCDACETRREAIQTKDGVTRCPARRREGRGPSTETGVRRLEDVSTDVPSPLEPPELDDQPELEHDFVAPDVRLYPGDALASQAFYMALLGFCVPFVTWYSVFLLLRIRFGKNDLGPQGRALCRLATAVVVANFVFVLLVGLVQLNLISFN